MKENNNKIAFPQDSGKFRAGAVCPMPGKGGIGGAKGAMGSAIVTLILWNMNIILAGLGLGSVAFGAWFAKYRYFLYAFTFSLLTTSFYRIYFKHKGDVGKKTKITLWLVAGLSMTLTLMSIIKNLKAH